jgi:hypothetical protein
MKRILAMSVSAAILTGAAISSASADWRGRGYGGGWHGGYGGGWHEHHHGGIGPGVALGLGLCLGALGGAPLYNPPPVYYAPPPVYYPPPQAYYAPPPPVYYAPPGYYPPPPVYYQRGW